MNKINWHENNQREKLEGLKQIADYLGIDRRTLARRRKECEENPDLPNFPIGLYGPRRYYAYTDELDKWKEKYERQIKEKKKQKSPKIVTTPDIIENSDKEKPKISNQQQTNTKPINIINSNLVMHTTILSVVIVFLGIFITYFIFGMNNTNNDTNYQRNKSKLIVKHSLKENLIIIKVYPENTNDTNTKTFVYEFNTPMDAQNKVAFAGEKPFFYARGDFNGDKKQDIVLMKPGEKNTIQIFFQQNNRLILKKEKKFHIRHKFGNKEYEINEIRFVQTGDLNNDGKDEIVVLLINPLLFPSCAVILNNNFEPYFYFFNPGWLVSAKIKDLNNDSTGELYIAGTNNNLTEYSEEIALAIETKWNNILNQKPIITEWPNFYLKNFKTVYVRLNYLNRLENKWQIARIENSLTHSDFKDKILVFGGLFDWKTYNLISKYWIKTFEFGYLLRLKDSWIYNANLKKLNINLSKKEIKALLTPRYWNGTNWQNQWCVVKKRGK